MRFIKIVLICLSIMLITGTVSGDQVDNTTCNATIDELNKKISELNKEIKDLKDQVNKLNVENVKLTAERDKLKNQINDLESWDARQIMDELYIYQVTSKGPKYDLIFHEGGLGGIVVYQYVGPWQGDAGKWRQYKQIAFYKPEQLKEGYQKPGIVLKPVWGFDNETIRVRTLADIIKIENKYNNIYGLTVYLDWVRNKYFEATKYDASKIISIMVISVMFGLVIGEVKQPIRRLVDRITIRTMTDFGERRPSKALAIIMASGIAVISMIIYANTQEIMLTIGISLILMIIAMVIYRLLR